MQEIINSFGIDWKIFSAEIVNFLVIVGILYFFVFKKIFMTLDKRRSIISDGIKKSEMAEENLKDAEKKSGQIISDARGEASEKINLAINTAKETEERILTEAKKKGEDIIEKAKKTGQEQKNDIISEADKEIAKRVILGMEKVMIEK